MNNIFLKLFAHCIPVQGKAKSCIYDLYRGELNYIPNTMVDFLNLANDNNIEKILSSYSEQKNVLEEYVNFLISNQLAFQTENSENFPKLTNQYNRPWDLHEAIINHNPNFNIKRLVRELDNANCKTVEIRLIYEGLKFDDLSTLINAFEGTTIRSVVLIIREFSNEDTSKIISAMSFNKKISGMIITNSAQENSYVLNETEINVTEIDIEEMLDEKHKKITPIINYDFFMEAQFHNPYYNDKIFIDFRGDIKNASFINKSFGNIFTHSIQEVLEEGSIKELWNAKPDDIIDLKDSVLKYCLYLPYKLERISSTSNLYKYVDLPDDFFG